MNEVCRECRLALVLTLVDYEKAFDSVEVSAFLSALIDQEVDSPYLRALAGCHTGCKTTVQLIHRPLAFSFGRRATSQITETFSYVSFERSKHGLRYEGRARAAWADFEHRKEAIDHLTDQDLRPIRKPIWINCFHCTHLCNRHCGHVKHGEEQYRALEQCLLQYNRRTQHRA